MMKGINVYVFSPELDLLGIVDVVTSVTWEEKFADAGDFDLWCPLTDNNISLLQEDNLLWKGGETAGVIEIKQLSADSDEPQINVQGRLIESYLDYRTVYPELYTVATVSAVMYKLVNNNLVSPTDAKRKIPRVYIGSNPSYVGPEVSYKLLGSSVLTECKNIGYAYRFGFKMQFLPKESKLVFSVYNTTDRTISQSSVPPVYFASDLDDILESSYFRNKADTRNSAYIAGEISEDNPQVISSAYSGSIPSGIQRRELFVDASDIQRSIEYKVVKTTTTTRLNESTIRVDTVITRTNTSTEQTTVSTDSVVISDSISDDGVVTEEYMEYTPMPEDDYKQLLSDRGRTVLEEYQDVESFEAITRSFGETNYKYGTDFVLGDKITVYDSKLKLRINAVVTSVKTVHSTNGEQLEMTFGYTQPTVSEKLRKAGV